MTGEVRLGEVAEFDEDRGLGVVVDAASGEQLPFHCTEIAGGSRTIAVAARVAFLRRAARAGRVEAYSVAEIAAGSP